MATVKHWTAALDRFVLLRNGTSDITIWENTFEREQHLPPATMPAPRTVLDLGANIGLTAAAYQGLWPEAEIIAVEMDSENVRLARRNFSGPVIEGAVVYRYRDGLTYDSSVQPASYTLGEGSTPVKQVPFMEVLGYFSEPVDFVKMDIEGQEEEILSHAHEWVDWVDHLLVECHVAVGSYSHDDAMEDLRTAGFKVGLRNAGLQAVWAWH